MPVGSIVWGLMLERTVDGLSQALYVGISGCSMWVDGDSPGGQSMGLHRLDPALRLYVTCDLWL